jgi:N-acetylglutamate synthase-like GNAT family acetyltransferase
MKIRRAETADAVHIARIHVRAWQSEYGDYIKPDYLEAMSEQESAMRWLKGLADIRQPETFVALEGNDVIGWVGFGHNRDDLGHEVGELHGLYVDPECPDPNAASALLLLEAESRLAESGFSRGMVWALAEDASTRRFYEERGWLHDGVTDIHESLAAVVRYVKDFNGDRL